ncbi:hypothetical protein [Mobilicoccus massiliensis]|uniref:hypothetical protein n=1 Tax=Mobilicoccus massiliensis TaxID=1522310 RepID=UPI00058B42B0|nr:hypothetical protein [Mobilicoccus massiliensis]
MDTDDLFDRIASELATSGAVEDEAAPTRTLTVDGTPFARLAGDGAEVYLPAGSPARGDALHQHAVSRANRGWVAVSAEEVSLWPTLFEQALQGVRG